MRISQEFTNDYFRAEDIDDKSPVTATIHLVSRAEVGHEDRLLLEFSDHDQGLLLNKTNALTLSDLFGDDTDKWRGKVIELYRDKVMFQGKRVAAVRVRAAQQQPQPPL